MKSFLTIACITSAFVTASLGSIPARAEVITAAGAPALCVDWNTSTNNVALWDCHGGNNQNFFTSAYGQQRSGNMCLDHGPLSDPGNLRGGYVIMAPCADKKSQRWLLTDGNDRNAYRLRNEEGTCLNIPGGMGYAKRGQALVVWTCQTGFGSSINDVWSRGNFTTASVARLPQSAFNQMSTPGRIYVSASGILTNNGGTIVAAGGGNVVSQGGGNVIVISGGAVVSQGGGNLITSDGAGLVNTNGGNLVGSGGASAISNNGSSLRRR